MNKFITFLDYRSEINAQIVAVESEPSLSPLERITRKQAIRLAWHNHQIQQQTVSGRISSQPTSHSALPTFEPTVLNVVGKTGFFLFLCLCQKFRLL